ncbi:MAG: hypothetical protein AAFQ94_30205 [Bacteroidota bacterium]
MPASIATDTQSNSRNNTFRSDNVMSDMKKQSENGSMGSAQQAIQLQPLESDKTDTSLDSISGNGEESIMMAGNPAGGGNSSQRNNSSDISCRTLIDMPGLSADGNAAHRIITAHFISTTSGATASIGIPTASFTPFRTEGCAGDPPHRIGYQTIGGKKAGIGYPDLVRRQNTEVQIAEIKPATYPCVEMGEKQLANYVAKGNSDEAATYRFENNIGIFTSMPTRRYRPAILIYDNKTSLISQWCSDGLLVYKRVPNKKIPVPVPIPVPVKKRVPVRGKGKGRKCPVSHGCHQVPGMPGGQFTDKKWPKPPFKDLPGKDRAMTRPNEKDLKALRDWIKKGNRKPGKPST